MWDGFVPVGSTYGPPVYEGHPAVLTISNAGPCAVMAHVWDSAQDGTPKPHPDRSVQLWAGDTRTVSGGLVVLKLIPQPNEVSKYAAAGWRVLRSAP
jgi:hypothetical protein